MAQNYNPFDAIEIRLNQIEHLLIDIKHQRPAVAPITPQAEQIFDVPVLSKYLKQAQSTTYKNIPNYPRRKNGKSWIFLKSEIDEWLKSQKVKSKAEMKEDLRAEAQAHLDNLKVKK